MNSALLLNTLRQHRLLAEEGLTDLLASPSATESSSLLSALIDRGLLTPYQAKQVWEGRAGHLVLGQYRLLDELGRGGHGQVYKALHTLMNRVVAIKVVKPECVESVRALDWLRREVLAITELHHSNLVMAYDANEVDNVLFLVMEFVDGPDLQSLVKKEGRLPVPLACEIIRQVALGLQYACDKGMVHRDIKPANILIPRQSYLDAVTLLAARDNGAKPAPPPVLAKIADFGLARLQATTADNTLSLASEKSFAGTPDYVSPEQARDVHAVDIRSDLYSLGCTFYFALTGERPFKGKTPLEIVLKHLHNDPEPVEQYRPDLPPALAALMRRLMHKSPAERFQTPLELAQELGPWCVSPLSDFELNAWAARPRSSADLCIDRPVAEAKQSQPLQTAVVKNLFFWNGPRLEEPEDNAVSANTSPTCVVEQSLTDTSPPLMAADEAPATFTPASCAEVASEADAAVGADPNLQAAWKRWVAVVAAFATKGKARCVDESLYQSLYRELLRACRCQLAQAGANDKEPLRQVEALIQPWLTAQSLAQTDRETLRSLVKCCFALEQELGWGGTSWTIWHWLPILATLAAAVLGGIYFAKF